MPIATIHGFQRAATACLSVLIGMTAAHAETQRPNIVLLYTDDQAYWAVGANGNAEIHTPNLDRLCHAGARFTNAFVVTPVCSPSRVGLIASRWGFEVGITDWINPRTEPELGLDPAIVTWPEVLAEAGYVNGLVGKWHLGTQPKFHPHKVGFKHFMGFLPGGTRPMKPKLEIDGVVKELSASLPDLLVDDAIKFVERNKDRPFTMSVHFRAPHAPYHPVPSEDSAHYVGKELTVPDYPGLNRNQVERLTREYYGSVSSVDRNVGRLLDKLDALNLTTRTIVIFTSDHGYNIGHHGIRHKGNARWIVEGKTGRRPNMYDTSIRVPMAIRWPGVVKPDTVFTRTVSNLDLYPTMLAMAGVKLPKGVKIHGSDFSPLLRGHEAKWDDTLFGYYDMHHGYKSRMRMIRTPGWKLVRHYGPATPPDELYHLATDPDEHVNLIDAPTQHQRLIDLRARLLAWQKSVNDPLLTQSK